MTNAQHPSFDSSQPSQQALELGVLERVFADAVADRVADLLSSQLRSVDLVDAATLATALNVSRDWVYAHSAELGGIRIGPGNRGRLRFDLGRVLDIWRASERTGPGSEVQHRADDLPRELHEVLARRDLWPETGPHPFFRFGSRCDRWKFGHSPSVGTVSAHA